MFLFHSLCQLFPFWHFVTPVVRHATTEACTIAHNNPVYAAWLKAHHLKCTQV